MALVRSGRGSDFPLLPSSDLSPGHSGKTPHRDGSVHPGIHPFGVDVNVAVPTSSAASGAGYAGLVRLYDVESAAALPAEPWSGLPGLTNLVGTNGTVTVTVPCGGPQRFYRLKVRLQ